jgi:hypothetical protein
MQVRRTPEIATHRKVETLMTTPTRVVFCNRHQRTTAMINDELRTTAMNKEGQGATEDRATRLKSSDGMEHQMPVSTWNDDTNDDTNDNERRSCLGPVQA